MQRSLLTRVLHLLVALAVTHQLLTSAVMHWPRGNRVGDGFWQAHEVVGLTSLGILFVFWGWTLLRRRETPVGRLFPWLSPRGRAALRADAMEHWQVLRQLRLPHGEDRPLVSAVHGLGLALATLMALTGAAFFLRGLAPDLLVSGVLNIHGAAGNLMWAYLIGHAGLALLHELMGHRVLRRMAPIGAEQG